MLEKDNNILLQGDCMEILPNIPKESVDLVLVDPPYNIGKAKWDKIDNYTNWLGGVFKELERVLKSNGSFYFFHNDFLQLVEIQNYINKNTEFQFKQFIVWNKKFTGSSKEGFLQGFNEVEGLRNYQKMAEYSLFYVKKDDLGITTKNIEENNHPTLRQYFKDFLQYFNLNISKVNKILGHRRAEHCLYVNSSQWDKPTEAVYKELIDVFDMRSWSGFKEYDWIESMFWEERYTFNNLKKHHSVWNYESAEKQGHITPKPVGLLEDIILYSSNEGDVVLDCFMGSGSTGVACKNTNRRFIGIELDEDYFNIAKGRIENIE